MAGADFTFSRTQAWMNVPESCCPPIRSMPAHVIKSATSTILFRSSYSNVGLNKRIVIAVGRAFFAIAVAFCALVELVAMITVVPVVSIATLKWRAPAKEDIIAFLALPILSLGMFAGYLPPLSSQRFDYVEKPDAPTRYYLDLCELRQEGVLPEDQGTGAANAFMKANPEAIHFNIVLRAAGANGDINALKILIEQGGKKVTKRAIQKALICSTTRVHGAAMKYLIEHGADPHHDAVLLALLLDTRKYTSHFVARIGNPEEAARVLGESEVEFNNPHLDELAKGMQLIKENKIDEFYNWLDADDQLEPRLFKKYMKTQVNGPPPIFMGLNEGDGWIRALHGFEREVFINRFEKVYQTLIAVKKEQIEKREKAIIEAVEVLPQAGLANIISEYCYS